MQLIFEYIRENKTRFFVVLIVLIILIIGMIFSNNRDNDKKIYISDDYIYTKETYKHANELISELPYINIDNDRINEINIDLIKKYYEIITIDKKMIKYNVFKYDDIVSLIVSIYYQEAPDVVDEMYFYNINIEKERIISNEELFDMYDVSKDNISNAINNGLKEYYDYEVSKGYISNSCDFDCYLSNIGGLPLLDNCNYYVKDGSLYVYKNLSLNSNFYYDGDTNFELFNFKIK